MMKHNMIYPENIPHELKELEQWVLWKSEAPKKRFGNESKVPYQPNGKKASPANPETWTSFENVLDAYGRGGYSGIGFVLSEDDPYCAIDLDNCRDIFTGIISPWAMEIIVQMRGYTELSPTKSGVHIIVKGIKPGNKCRAGSVEMYTEKRYITMTGDIAV